MPSISYAIRNHHWPTPQATKRRQMLTSENTCSLYESLYESFLFDEVLNHLAVSRKPEGTFFCMFLFLPFPLSNPPISNYEYALNFF